MTIMTALPAPSPLPATRGGGARPGRPRKETNDASSTIAAAWPDTGAGVVTVAPEASPLSWAAPARDLAPPPQRRYVTLDGPRTLGAAGSGVMHCRAAHVVVAGHAVGAVLTLRGDASVRLERFESVRRDPDGGVTYSGVRGALTITGHDVDVVLGAGHMRLWVSGRGRVALTGHGWRRMDGGDAHRWAQPLSAGTDRMNGRTNRQTNRQVDERASKGRR